MRKTLRRETAEDMGSISEATTRLPEQQILASQQQSRPNVNAKLICYALLFVLTAVSLVRGTPSSWTSVAPPQIPDWHSRLRTPIVQNEETLLVSTVDQNQVHETPMLWEEEDQKKNESITEQQAILTTEPPAMIQQTRHREPLLQTCGQEKFRSALAELYSTTNLPGVNASAAVEESYMRYADIDRKCVWDETQWPVSSKKLIIDLGPGTTGTRWTTKLMRQWGLQTTHNLMSLAHCKWNCTKRWDRYDFVADSPVGFQAWQLLQSHPESLVLLSVRDGAEWQASRLKHHSEQNAWKWGVEGPCGNSRHRLGFEDGSPDPGVPADFTAYLAWAMCIVPEDRLLVYNVFDPDEKDGMLRYRLRTFLTGHGIVIRRPGSK